jgi:hypothetical protein
MIDLKMQSGLFAGVVASFLVDSQDTLQEDPQDTFLREILITLRNASNDPPPLPFQRSPFDVTANYLWSISLTLTLVGALGGVLAKEWLTEYAPPTRGMSAIDACNRHLRALRSHQWYLGKVIAAIPLVVQLALVLFLIALALSFWDNELGIGVTIIALTFLAVFLYFLGTLLPIFSPHTPYRTTLSTFVGDLFGGIKPQTPSKRSMYVIPRSRAKGKALWPWQVWYQVIEELHHLPDVEELRVKILSWTIRNSTRPKNIDAAIKAVAGLPASQLSILQKTMESSDSLLAFYEKFRTQYERYSGPDASVEALSRSEGYFHAMLQLTPGMKSLKTARPYALRDLPKHWEDALKGLPKHWKDIHQSLLPLALCIRLEILLILGEDEEEENWHASKWTLVKMLKTGCTPKLRKRLLKIAMSCLAEENKPNLHRMAGVMLSWLVKLGSTEFFEVWPDGVTAQDLVVANLAQRLMIDTQMKVVCETAGIAIHKLSLFGTFSFHCYYCCLCIQTVQTPLGLPSDTLFRPCWPT